MVDLCANLTGIEDAHIAGKSFISRCIYVRVFVEEISIWVGRLSEEIPSSPMWTHIIQSIERLNRLKKKKAEKG